MLAVISFFEIWNKNNIEIKNIYYKNAKQPSGDSHKIYAKINLIAISYITIKLRIIYLRMRRIFFFLKIKNYLAQLKSLNNWYYFYEMVLSIFHFKNAKYLQEEKLSFKIFNAFNHFKFDYY